VRTRAQIPTRKALGRVLREFREQRDMSQEELGYAAKLHRNYVGGVERGVRNPTFESLARWLAAANITWREFGDAIERKAGSSG
jgi:transcriptional regulator with XRE-family HTH domain